MLDAHNTFNSHKQVLSGSRIISNSAIELYHQALSLKPDDTFTCEMLTEALKDLDEAVDPTQLGFGPPTGGVAGGAGASSAAVSMEE